MALARCVGLLASSAFLCGSSMISRSAPRPVIGPPTPAVIMPPLCSAKSQRSAAEESERRRTPKAGPLRSRTSRLAAPAGREAGLVAGQDDALLGKVSQKPRGEVLRRQHGLAMARRHGDEQAAHAARGDGHQLTVEQV